MMHFFPYFDKFESVRRQLYTTLKPFQSLVFGEGIVNETYIASATGEVLAQVPAEVEGYVMVEAALPDALYLPKKPSPRFGLSFLAYLLGDMVLTVPMIPKYRRGVRNTYGEQMAPLDLQTRIWIGVVGLVV